MKSIEKLSVDAKRCMKNFRESKEINGFDSINKEVFLKDPMYCNGKFAIYEYLKQLKYIEDEIGYVKEID